jgi:LmbE family N-acetylglucosaminyl deacetylase
VLGERVLILAPHPDDEVVGCCAAATRAIERGAAVHVLYLTTGVPAPEVVWPWQRTKHPLRVARRREEALAVARTLGLVPAGFGEIPTRTLKSHIAAALRELEGAIARHSIDTLWAPAYEGAHQDHDVAHFLTSLVTNSVAACEYAAYNFAGAVVCSQTFCDPDGTETTIELTGDESRAKRAALDAYASERGNLGHVGVARESIRSFRHADYSRPPHPGCLFYERFQWVPFRHPRVDFTPSAEVRRAINEHAERGLLF